MTNPGGIMSDVTIPKGIPADIWETACSSVDEWSASSSSHPNIARRIIARAILAERERAARIAEDLAANRKRLEQQRGFGPKTATAGANSYWCEEIAQAIRSSHE